MLPGCAVSAVLITRGELCWCFSENHGRSRSALPFSQRSRAGANCGFPQFDFHGLALCLWLEPCQRGDAHVPLNRFPCFHTFRHGDASDSGPWGRRIRSKLMREEDQKTCLKRLKKGTYYRLVVPKPLLEYPLPDPGIWCVLPEAQLNQVNATNQGLHERGCGPLAWI